MNFRSYFLSLAAVGEKFRKPHGCSTQAVQESALSQSRKPRGL